VEADGYPSLPSLRLRSTAAGAAPGSIIKTPLDDAPQRTEWKEHKQNTGILSRREKRRLSAFRVGSATEAKEEPVKKKSPRKSAPAAAAKPTLDTEAMTATIAGFLACHVLTLRFLAQEGIVNRERLIAFLETAVEGMTPGIADQRSLFVLNQVLNSLRQPMAETGLQ
jgi:hypothetical protein